MMMLITFLLMMGLNYFLPQVHWFVLVLLLVMRCHVGDCSAFFPYARTSIRYIVQNTVVLHVPRGRVCPHKQYQSLYYSNLYGLFSFRLLQMLFW